MSNMGINDTNDKALNNAYNTLKSTFKKAYFLYGYIYGMNFFKLGFIFFGF
ncbi:hypothetical protein CAPN008_09430 [Capnocytophaga canis]|nr:hypothetical protein CAPN008_09430 [Capnocytophaga canis]